MGTSRSPAAPVRTIDVDEDADAIAHADRHVALDVQAVLTRLHVVRRRRSFLSHDARGVNTRAHDELKVAILVLRPVIGIHTSSSTS